jgi:hypothetical protein
MTAALNVVLRRTGPPRTAYNVKIYAILAPGNPPPDVGVSDRRRRSSHRGERLTRHTVVPPELADPDRDGTRSALGNRDDP